MDRANLSKTVKFFFFWFCHPFWCGSFITIHYSDRNKTCLPTSQCITQSIECRVKNNNNSKIDILIYHEYPVEKIKILILCCQNLAFSRHMGSKILNLWWKMSTISNLVWEEKALWWTESRSTSCVNRQKRLNVLTQPKYCNYQANDAILISYEILNVISLCNIFILGFEATIFHYLRLAGTVKQWEEEEDWIAEWRNDWNISWKQNCT